MTDKVFSKYWTINSPDVVTETFDGQAVVLDLSNGHYFSLNGSAGRVWSLITAGYAIDSIEAIFAEARPDRVAGLQTFLAEIVRRKLVRPEPTGRSERPEGEIAWSDETPELIVYDDLAELIYADPIHDVDEEQGWPVQRPAGG